MYDSNGSLVNDSALAFSYVWTISIYYLRPSTATRMVLTPKFVNYNGTQSFTIATVKAHGPVIAGSFGLQIAQYTVTYAGTNYVRYNIMPWDLQNSIRAIPGF